MHQRLQAEQVMFRRFERYLCCRLCGVKVVFCGLQFIHPKMEETPCLDIICVKRVLLLVEVREKFDSLKRLILLSYQVIQSVIPTVHFIILRPRLSHNYTINIGYGLCYSYLLLLVLKEAKGWNLKQTLNNCPHEIQLPCQ